MRVFAFILFVRLAAGADLSLPSLSAAPGSSIVISATLSPGADSVAGLQFDLQYDNTALSFLSIPGDASRGAGKTIYYKDLSANQRRFIVAGVNQIPMPAGSAVDLFVNISPITSNGNHPLIISNLIFTDGAGNTVPGTSTSGGVVIGGTTTVNIQPTGVLNAATFISGPVAPGEIITLVGSGIGPMIATSAASSGTNTVLGGTSLLFDGAMAPLLYAGLNQINAIVPFEVAGQSTTSLMIESNGQVIAGFPLSVAPAAPGIFTLNASGSGPGSILNQDLTINSPSNRAAPGSVVVLYATGAGAMNPQPADGQIEGDVFAYPNLAVSVTIGGIDAQVLYAGSAPGSVAGLLQVNCVVPPNVTPGDSVGVILTVGAIPSPPGVVIAVSGSSD